MASKYDQEQQDSKYDEMFSGSVGFRKNQEQAAQVTKNDNLDVLKKREPQRERPRNTAKEHAQKSMMAQEFRHEQETQYEQQESDNRQYEQQVEEARQYEQRELETQQYEQTQREYQSELSRQEEYRQEEYRQETARQEASIQEESINSLDNNYSQSGYSSGSWYGNSNSNNSYSDSANNNYSQSYSSGDSYSQSGTSGTDRQKEEYESRQSQQQKTESSSDYFETNSLEDGSVSSHKENTGGATSERDRNLSGVEFGSVNNSRNGGVIVSNDSRQNKSASFSEAGTNGLSGTKASITNDTSGASEKVKITSDGSARGDKVKVVSDGPGAVNASAKVKITSDTTTSGSKITIAEDGSGAANASSKVRISTDNSSGGSRIKTGESGTPAAGTKVVISDSTPGASSKVKIDSGQASQSKKIVVSEPGSGSATGKRTRVSDGDSFYADINNLSAQSKSRINIGDSQSTPSSRVSVQSESDPFASASRVSSSSGSELPTEKIKDARKLMYIRSHDLVNKHARLGEEMLLALKTGDVLGASDAGNKMLEIEKELGNRGKSGLLASQLSRFRSEKAKILASRPLGKEKAEIKVTEKADTGYVPRSALKKNGRLSGLAKKGANATKKFIHSNSNLDGLPEEVEMIKKGTRATFEAGRVTFGAGRSAANSARSAQIKMRQMKANRSAKFSYGRGKAKKKVGKKQIKKMRQRIFRRNKTASVGGKVVKGIGKLAKNTAKLVGRMIMAPFLIPLLIGAAGLILVLGVFLASSNPVAEVKVTAPSGMQNDSDLTNSEGKLEKIIQAALNKLWLKQKAYEMNLTDCDLSSEIMSEYGLPKKWMDVVNNKTELKEKSPAVVKKGDVNKGMKISSYWGERSNDYYSDTIEIKKLKEGATGYDEDNDYDIKNITVKLNGPPGLKGNAGTFTIEGDVKDGDEYEFDVDESSKAYKNLYDTSDPTNINKNYEVVWEYRGSAFTQTFTNVKTLFYYIGKGNEQTLAYMNVNGGQGLNINQYNDNATAIWDYLIDMGLSEAGAAGVMGNAWQESGFNPEAYNSAGYYGIFQWGLGRKTELESLPDYQSLQTQMDFFRKEIQRDLPQLLEFLKTVDDPEYAAEAFLAVNERAVAKPYADGASQLRYNIPTMNGYGASAGEWYQNTNERTTAAATIFTNFSGRTPEQDAKDEHGVQGEEYQQLYDPADSTPTPSPTPTASPDAKGNTYVSAADQLAQMTKKTYTIKDFYHAIVSMGIAFSWNSPNETEEFITAYYEKLFDLLCENSTIEITEGSSMKYQNNPVKWKVKIKGKTYKCSAQHLTRKITIKITFNDLGIQDLMKQMEREMTGEEWVQWAKDNKSIAYTSGEEKRWDGWYDGTKPSFCQEWALEFAEMNEKDWEYFFPNLRFPGQTVGTLTSADIKRIIQQIEDNQGETLTDEQKELLEFALSCVGRATYEYRARYTGSSTVRPSPDDCPTKLDCSGFMSFALFGGGVDKTFNDRTAAALTTCYHPFRFDSPDIGQNFENLKPCTMVMPNQDNGENSGAHVVMYLGKFVKTEGDIPRPWCVECTTTKSEDGREIDGITISPLGNMEMMKTRYHFCSYPFDDWIP